MSENPNRFEIAHLARVELFSPKPQETEDFFTRFLGMYVTHREGQSVYLRGYEDPYQWSLKVTESAEAGMGHAALRTSSPDALERLKTAHRSFAQTVQDNQLVLATARAVSEGLVKGIAEEMNRQARPQGYGPATAPVSRHPAGGAPLVLSKSL